MYIYEMTCEITCLQNEPQSLDFLQALFVHSLMEENIKSYNLWRLHCLILTNFWYDERRHILKLVQLLLSTFLDVCGNYDTKCKLSHRTCAVFTIVPDRKNVQGHTYCKQSWHGLYIPSSFPSSVKQNNHKHLCNNL